MTAIFSRTATLVIFMLWFAPAALAAKSIIVIAHRGNHENAHENTIEAIRDAITIGADYVELDVRRTRDGRHVLLHNRTLKAMTGVDRPVAELTLEEVRQLKVIDPGRPQIAASHIPTFEEALEAMDGKIGLYLDFKDGDPAWLTDQLRRSHQLEKTVVYLSPSSFKAWKKAAPEIRVIMSIPGDSLTPDSLAAFLKNYPGIILDGPVTDYTAELVQSAHKSGLQIWPDIQNPGENPDQWTHALEMGLDGLQTDHPSALIAWLKKNGHAASTGVSRPRR